MTCGDPGVCDKVTGHCNGSCLAGWEGDMCQNGNTCVKKLYMYPIDSNALYVIFSFYFFLFLFRFFCFRYVLICLNDFQLTLMITKTIPSFNSCKQVLFFFLECPIGLYGVNCLQNCSLTCGHPGKCDRVTGHCNGGCQRGWTGVRCEEGKRQRNNKNANKSILFKK